MFTQELVEQIIHFVIGKPHKTMGVAFLMVVVNIIVTFFKEKQLWNTLKEGIERIFAYTAFIILANVLDMLAIDSLFGWDGSTQFMVCLYIVARELRQISNYLTERFGISIPIINDRLDQMEGGHTRPDVMWQDPSINLDKRIDRLRSELDSLEQRRFMAEQKSYQLENPTEDNQQQGGNI